MRTTKNAAMASNDKTMAATLAALLEKMDAMEKSIEALQGKAPKGKATAAVKTATKNPVKKAGKSSNAKAPQAKGPAKNEPKFRTQKRGTMVFLLAPRADKAMGTQVAWFNSATKRGHAVLCVKTKAAEKADLALLREFFAAYVAAITPTKKITASGLTTAAAIKRASFETLSAVFGC